MKRILPAPYVFVTMSGTRPKRFVSVPCVARISVPALARRAGAYHWKPGSVCQTRALASSVSSSFVSRLRVPASVSANLPGDEVPQPRGCASSQTTGRRSASGVSCSEASVPAQARQEDEAAA